MLTPLSAGISDFSGEAGDDFPAKPDVMQILANGSLIILS
jgi:hypothetical protein